MNNGWVKFHRQLVDKGYYKDSEYVHLWIHILMKANHADSEFLWNGTIIKVGRGQLITGRDVLSAETGIKSSKIQRVLKVFENEQQIEQQTTNKFRLITILNYEKYQSTEQQNKPPLNSQRTATEHKQEEQELKNIYIKEQLEPFSKSYPPKILIDFELYWGEKNTKGKERWQLQKTWDIKRRLQRWKRNQEDREHQNNQRFIKKDEAPKQRTNAGGDFSSIGDTINKR